jgi:hypothetical protein
MLGLDTWRKATSRLIAVDSHLSRAAAEKRLSTLLQELNDLAIPIEGLAESEVHQFLGDVTQVPTFTPCTVPYVAQLCFSILTKQRVKLNTMCCSSVCLFV